MTKDEKPDQPMSLHDRTIECLCVVTPSDAAAILDRLDRAGLKIVDKTIATSERTGHKVVWHRGADISWLGRSK